MWFAVFLPVILEVGGGSRGHIFQLLCSCRRHCANVYNGGDQTSENLEFSENFDFEKRWRGPLITNLDPLNGH